MQAVCKRYGLEIGAYCAWLVRALMVVTAPVSWPLGKLLDYLLGEESALFRRQELKALVGIHAETQQDGSGAFEPWGAGGCGREATAAVLLSAVC